MIKNLVSTRSSEHLIAIKHLRKFESATTSIYIYMHGVLLPDRQTFRGDNTHEDKH